MRDARGDDEHGGVGRYRRDVMFVVVTGNEPHVPPAVRVVGSTHQVPNIGYQQSCKNHEYHSSGTCKLSLMQKPKTIHHSCRNQKPSITHAYHQSINPSMMYDV